MKLRSSTTDQQMHQQRSSRKQEHPGFGVKRAPPMMLVIVLVAALTIGQAGAFSRVPPPTSSSTSPPPPPVAAPTAPPSTPPPSGGGDDGYGLDQPCDANWNSTAAQYRTNLEKWGSPGCYVFTIQRSCFCTDVVRNATEVRVVNGTIVSPANYEELFLVPVQELFDQINDLCVKNCPERGAARCDVSYGPDGNVASTYIDRSEMIADEEISYTITGYRTCPTPTAASETGSSGNRNRNRRLRHPAH